ncbi:MAG: DUF6785 family protein [Armatimonadota bacterium]
MRALLIGIALLVVANIWMKYAALITVSAQVAMSVPPIPALMGLVVLLALGALLRRIAPTLALSRAEMLVIYVFLTLAVALTSGGALRSFMPSLTALEYFATPENGWAEYVEHQPDWLFPKGEAVVRGYFEGTEAGVPWGAWIGPLAAWSVFFLLMLGGLVCLGVLYYDEWAHSERLQFQLTELPLSMTAPQRAGGRIPQLWRDPVMWTGFAGAALHNVLNIANAFNPAAPALGLSYPIGRLFTERPWTALNNVILHHRPEVLGFGYLMPQEVVVSSLAFYALIEAESVGALAMGYDIPQFPHFESQAGGAFVALALVVTWTARRALVRTFRDAFAGEGPPVKRWAVCGLLVSIAGVWLWWRLAGMSSITILMYFGLLMMMGLAYARIRAQTGLPLQWGYPVNQANHAIVWTFGSDFLKRLGGLPNLTMLYTGWFLTRGYLPNLSAYGFEGLHIAREAGVRWREMIAVLLLAILLGMTVSYVVQLDAYYELGANFLEGGTHTGGTRVGAATYGFSLLRDAATAGIPANRGKIMAFSWGVLATIALTALRHRFLGFPLHHLGFIIGTTRGYRAWGGLLFAAIIKSLAITVGGVSLYRRLIPGAVGVVLGHFMIGGGVWSIVAVFGGEAHRAYQIWFG